MEDLAEGSLKLLLKASYMMLRAMAWIIMELGYERLAWWSGWCVCRSITLNRYPPQRISGFDQAPGVIALVVGGTGLLSLLVLAAMLAIVIEA